MSSWNVCDILNEQKAVVWLHVVEPLFCSTETNTAFEMCTLNFASLHVDFKILNINPTKRVQFAQDYYGTPTCPGFYCFRNEMLNICFPKGKVIPVVFVTRIIVLVLGIKACCLAYGWKRDCSCWAIVHDPESKVSGQCKTWTADYRLGLKHGLGYETRTKHYGLGIKHGLV